MTFQAVSWGYTTSITILKTIVMYFISKHSINWEKKKHGLFTPPFKTLGSVIFLKKIRKRNDYFYSARMHWIDQKW